MMNCHNWLTLLTGFRDICAGESVIRSLHSQELQASTNGQAFLLDCAVWEHIKRHFGKLIGPLGKHGPDLNKQKGEMQPTIWRIDHPSLRRVPGVEGSKFPSATALGPRQCNILDFLLGPIGGTCKVTCISVARARFLLLWVGRNRHQHTPIAHAWRLKCVGLRGSNTASQITRNPCLVIFILTRWTCFVAILMVSIAITMTVQEGTRRQAKL